MSQKNSTAGGSPNGGHNNNNASSSSSDVDELFDVKTYYFIGAYQQCLNEINKLARVGSLEKDCYMWRAYLAQQKYRVALDGIRDVPSAGADALQAIRRLAVYKAQPERRAEVLEWFDEHQNTVLGAEEPESGDAVAHAQRVQWLSAAAAVYYNEGRFETAVKLVHGRHELECLALAVQSLLRMNRADLARQQLARMQQHDDDATLTQLATSWLAIEAGGERLQDALAIYQDLCDKYAATALLLNGQAVCYIGLQRYDEAGDKLREALDRDASNYDTLVNSCVLADLSSGSSSAAGGDGGDQAQAQRLLSQLQAAHEGSDLVALLARKEAEFDRLCQKYGAAAVAVK